MVEDHLDMLRQTAFSVGLTDEEIGVISLICHVRRYGKGDELFSEASHGSELFIICKGRVAVEVALPNRPDKRSERLATAASGMIVGELALVDGSPRSARAYAMEDVEALEIRSDEIHQIMSAHPRIGYLVMKNLATVLASRLRNTNLWLRNELLWSR